MTCESDKLKVPAVFHSMPRRLSESPVRKVSGRDIMQEPLALMPQPNQEDPWIERRYDAMKEGHMTDIQFVGSLHGLEDIRGGMPISSG